tara:strand:- start:639 stop:1088 length:450 start_codon:yes stop_codon:yes gene_type:complete
MKKIFLILLFFTVSCGYTPINQSNNKVYSITKFELNGNNQINKIIKKNFDRYNSEKNLKSQFQINLSSQLIKKTNSKNKSGKNSNLSLKILVNSEILKEGKTLKELNFEEITNYNSLDNKFELKQYEKILIKDLTKKILDRIHFILSTN